MWKQKAWTGKSETYGQFGLCGQYSANRERAAKIENVAKVSRSFHLRCV